MIKNKLQLLILIFPLLIFSACSSKSAFVKQDSFHTQGDYASAIKQAEDEIDKGDPYARDNLLWELYLAQAYYFDNNMSASISTFDTAESLMKYHRERILSVSLTKDLSAILSNDNTQPYIGNEYDGTMLNTYKALAYLKQNDFSGARVEFNRVIDRQRRAKEFFYNSINKQKEAIRQESQENNQEGPSQEEEKNHFNSVLNQNYPELNEYQVYPNFVNPISNYLAALFALANKDHSKASYLLKEVATMLPKNLSVQDDYRNLDKIENEATVWVIYEDGLAPVLNEMRIDFPAWIFTSQVDVVSISLPRMHERTKAFDYLSIRNRDSKLATTEPFSSMEGVMKTEFKIKYPSIMRRAVLSAITKAGMQSAAKNSGSDLASFITTLYTIFSTQADTRLWTSLPKNFHIARFKRADLESVDIYMPQGLKVASVKLPEAKHSLIYVKIPTIVHKAHIISLPLGE